MHECREILLTIAIFVKQTERLLKLCDLMLGQLLYHLHWIVGLKRENANGLGSQKYLK